MNILKMTFKMNKIMANVLKKFYFDKFSKNLNSEKLLFHFLHLTNFLMTPLNSLRWIYWLAKIHQKKQLSI